MQRATLVSLGLTIALRGGPALAVTCPVPTPSPVACPQPTPSGAITFYAERDTMIPEAHKMNNDGGWGYGWIKVSQGAHNFGLLGFDVSGLISTDPEAVLDPCVDIESAILKLRVAQNHFAQDGRDYDVYAWQIEPQQVVDWAEGTNRFDLFSYCSQSAWARPAAQNDPAAPAGSFAGDGATWTCSRDSDTRDGSTACPTPTPFFRWDVLPEGTEKVPLGFSLPGVTPMPVASFFGKKQHPDSDPAQCQYCGRLAADIRRNCDPLCSKSIECYKNEVQNPDWGTPDACFRTVEIDVTSSLRDFVDAGVGHPSWVIRRNTNTGAGAFHYFSREGAVCILGECGRDPSSEPPIPDYKQLMPILEVKLRSGVNPPSPVIEPELDCSQSYPGRCPISTPAP